jgi:hypothetical protein
MGPLLLGTCGPKEIYSTIVLAAHLKQTHDLLQMIGSITIAISTGGIKLAGFSVVDILYI